MPRIKNAPLVEAIVEIRWGNEVKEDDSISLNYEKEDIHFFPGQFHGVAGKKGFNFVETINEAPMPFMINYRFRKQAETWPCYQIGLGIFTANQVKSGYEWKTFKQDVLAGAEMLNDGHPATLEKLPILYVELRYHDAFFLEEGETPSDFLKNKMNIGFNPSADFLNVPFLKSEVRGHQLKFQVETTQPEGVLQFIIAQATINGKEGFSMNTIVRSKLENLNTEKFSDWLETAHSSQKHAFDTLICSTYLQTFK